MANCSSVKVKLAKQGREWRGLSPFNAEKTPSFYVNDQKGFFHDFSSGKHGDGFTFLMETEGLSFPEAVEECMKAGLDSLKWSVNAADEMQFADVMGVAPKLFHRALDNIGAAWETRRRGGYRTGLYASSIRYDGEQQVKMEELLNARVRPFVDQHYWLPLYSMGAFATEREEKLGYRPTAGNQGRLDALRDPLPCWAVFTEGHITADGRLSACCFDADGRWTEVFRLPSFHCEEGERKP